MSDLDEITREHPKDYHDMWLDAVEKGKKNVEEIKAKFQEGYGVMSFEDLLSSGCYPEGYTEKDKEVFNIAMQFANNEIEIDQVVNFIKNNSDIVGDFTYVLDHVYRAGDGMPMEKAAEIIKSLIDGCK